MVVVLSRNLPHERLPTAIVNRRVTNVRPRLSNGEVQTVSRTKQAGYPGWGPIFVSLCLRILGQMRVASFLTTRQPVLVDVRDFGFISPESHCLPWRVLHQPRDRKSDILVYYSGSVFGLLNLFNADFVSEGLAGTKIPGSGSRGI